MPKKSRKSEVTDQRDPAGSVLTARMFILTAHSQDWPGGSSRRGMRHLLRYYGVSPEIGPVAIFLEREKPVFFVQHHTPLPPGADAADRKVLTLKNFAGEPVDALYFNSRRSAEHAAALFRRQGYVTYESDVRPERRFLMERFINAQVEVRGKPRRQGRLTTFVNPQIKAASCTPEFSVMSLDIETGDDGKRLYSIAMHWQGRGASGQKVLLSCSSGRALPEFAEELGSEKAVLENFIGQFEQVDPDIVIGWQVVGFDLLILDQKCREYGLKLPLSRDASSAPIRRLKSGGYRVDPVGRVVVDGPPALRAAFFSFEDYRLETVAQAVLGKGKAIEEVIDKQAEIDRLYQDDPAALARYNLTDAVLVSEIFARCGLIELLTRRSQISGLLLNEIGLSAAAFDHYFLPRLHRKGFVAPDVRDIRTAGEHAAGGYVMEPTPGIYSNVIVLDFKSLYPSIIRTFKIDPLSRLMASENPVQTPVGYRFSAGEHLLPEFIGELMEQRAQAKSAGDRQLSQAIKILMNSFYGVMGSTGCRFYHPDLPSAITETGQWLLKESIRYLKSLGYPVLYGDTDSLFVSLDSRKDVQASEVGERLASQINSYWRKRLGEFGVISFLEMEFEKHYVKFILPVARGKEGGARKRYAGLLKKGEAAELEFVGMEYVRSDWTELAKDFQHELYWRVMTGDEIKNWMRERVQAVLSGKCDQQLVYRKRLRKSLQEYTRNLSPQVRAAKMLPEQSREVRYVVTADGPVPLQLNPQGIDYRHYIEKQIKPIADSVLKLLGLSFDEIIYPQQLELF